jgi:hypothetical protein
MRCFSASSWLSWRSWLPSATYLPLGLKRKLRVVERSRGAPSFALVDADV